MIIEKLYFVYNFRSEPECRKDIIGGTLAPAGALLWIRLPNKFRNRGNLEIMPHAYQRARARICPFFPRTHENWVQHPMDERAHTHVLPRTRMLVCMRHNNFVTRKISKVKKNPGTTFIHTDGWVEIVSIDWYSIGFYCLVLQLYTIYWKCVHLTNVWPCEKYFLQCDILLSEKKKIFTADFCFNCRTFRRS